MTFIFVFYMLTDVEECIVSSFKIEEFYNVDMSTSLLRKISSFVPSQKAVVVTYRFTLSFFTSVFKQTADNISFRLLLSHSL
jgi:hypothetical protein